MRKSFGVKPVIYPMPVLIIGTYDEDGKANLMNAAWGGISNDTWIEVCLSVEHKTTQNLLKTGYLTISCGTLDTMKACDYVGMVSGNESPNKIEDSGFHCFKSNLINAPLVEELPFTLECKVISYDEETCILQADILNVSVDEKVLTDGKVDVSKLKPIAFDGMNHQYLLISDVVGQAFEAGISLIKK